MALSATVVFEVRPTNGTANAGGGFNASGSSPGTDYSQQNGVQVAFDGATISAATSGVTATILITGYAAAATDNRNLLAITGGTNFITGIYEIVSVSAGVSGVGTWTLDRNCTTGVGAAMTGNMGGARSGFAAGTTTLNANMVGGNIAWIKNEAWNEAVNISASGGAGTPIYLIGYNAARNDKPLTTGRPLNDRATAAGDAIAASGNDVWCFYLRATRAGDAGFSIATGTGRAYWCASYNNAGEGFECAGGMTAFACEAYSNTGPGWGANFSGYAHGCYSHDNTGNGFNHNNNGCTLTFCIAEANASSGCNGPAGGSYHVNNTFDGNTGASSDGVTTDVPRMVFGNNIMSNNGRDGARANSGAQFSVLAFNNDYYNNAGTARTNWPTGVGDIAVDPAYVDRTNGNFAVGTSVDNEGYPGAFPSATSTGYLGIGAVQSTPGGGSAGMLFIPDMAGT